MKRKRLTYTRELLTAFDVAQLLGRSVSTVYAWSERGILPAPVEYGGRYRWRERDIVAWAEAGFPQRERAEQEKKAKA